MSYKPSLLLMVMGMAAPALSNSNARADCFVRDSVRMDHPGEELLPLLAYVSRTRNMTLGFIFPGEKADRDAVCLNSTGATHSVVRNSKDTWMPINLPCLIPEGWNTFTVAVAEQGATVTLVQGLDELTLLTLSLPHRVTRVFAEGTISRCPTASPEWRVAAGRSATVVLQPGGSDHAQWLQLTSKGLETATPYVSFPFSQDKFPVPANTILKVTNSLHGDHALVRVFKDDDKDWKEVLKERVPIAPPLTMLVTNADEDSDIHLRLTLSSPLMNNVSSNTSTPSSAGDIRLPTTAALYVTVAMVVLVVIVVIGGALLFRHRIRNRNPLSKRKEESMDPFTPKPLTVLSQQKDFVGRIVHTTTNGLQILHLFLQPDSLTEQLLNELRNISTFRVELLLVKIPEASLFHTYLSSLPALPNIEKIKLFVSGFTERDLDDVCDLIEKLQPANGYAVIDFEENTASGDGEALVEEAWIKLLRSLSEKEVTVKGKVWLPTGAITEERQSLLPFRFSYGCRGVHHSLT